MCVLILRECCLRCRFDYMEKFGLQLLVFHMTKCHMCQFIKCQTICQYIQTQSPSLLQTKIQI